jgi:hypothetical protein
MIHILGIRHHGVGSARYLLERLHEIKPDLILIEGAPELDAVTSWVADENLCPPVAILAYNIDTPQQATFYPFADFSPEWQAMRYATQHKVAIRMIDAPSFSLLDIEKEDSLTPYERDPLSYLAEIEGFSHSGAWWDYRFEHRSDISNAAAYFEAIDVVMDTLRTAQLPSALEHENKYREAFMRRAIRQAVKEMYASIVVVCGAWHAPALRDTASTEKTDNAIIKSLPKQKIKIGVTWIPWTNVRLSANSGYGAGIESPGWSEYRWQYPTDDGMVWLSKVAQIFRQKHMDIASAHVIEAYRLVRSLCDLRQKNYPSLEDLNEAIITIMSDGDNKSLDIIQKTLIVGERIGQVPKNLPKHPLQTDFELWSKKLKLPQSPEKKEYELDLRKPLDLQRSIFLYRLDALQLSWGKHITVRSKGTFKEAWLLQWRPELMIELIERGTWGNTVELATMHFLQHKADVSQSIGEMATLIQQVIPAELFALIEGFLIKINNLAAISSDIIDLMRAIVPLIEVSRYGNVRKTDSQAVGQLVIGLIERICIGLPSAVHSLDAEAAQHVFIQIRSVNEGIRHLQQALLTEAWQQTLKQLLYQPQTPPLLSGCVCRLLLDAKIIASNETALLLSQALSKGYDATFAAAWLEGFLKGSSLILLYDETLWNILYEWIAILPQETFVEILPILRRTFSKFNPADRRQLGEKVSNGQQEIEKNTKENNIEWTFDEQLANKGLTKVLQLLEN